MMNFTSFGGDAKVSFKLGNGLTVSDADTSMSFNLSFINQNRIEVNKVFDKSIKPTVAAQVRRIRFRVNGYFFHNKLQYFTQIGLSPIEIKNGILLDAFVKYNPNKHFSLQFGQGKLPGNREQITPMQFQEFVDRSNTDALFRLDRDFGIQLQTTFGKKMIVKPTISVATGEGRNYSSASFQHFDYTARVEWLPLGDFKNYTYSDFVRDSKPKLALGVAYDFNNKAIFQNGQLGGNTIGDSLQKDIHTVIADMTFKWKGLNIYGDYIYRTVKNDTANSYRKGHSFFVASGYTFKKHYDIAFRYNHTFAGKTGNLDKTSDYTLSFAKYFYEHNLKIQTDYTFTDNKTTKRKNGLWRLQVQIII